ncbi:unnamed protein product [Cylindrotheca closterium]|uniref:Glutathione transferase n=1 Tax=Cylindrotheca closterium TaxID=2856 RepID=A0AAD2FG04_9STRA|nr:unnamed protein product [Cylindrotheca closterium]
MNDGTTSKVEPLKKGRFFDMKHSNNAARIRLWIRLKNLEESIDNIMLTHADIEAPGYKDINPLGKVPAFITDTGIHLFEGSVILQYLEDKFEGCTPKLVLDTPEDKAICNLIVRCHDLYIASPNCTQPNFSHIQGCMYLGSKPSAFTPASRTMTTDVRAAKLAELYQQLIWLEGIAQQPFLVGERITHADINWFPTAVFMELLLPRVFDWTPVFHETEINKDFKRLGRWFQRCMKEEHFAKTREEIRGTLIMHGENGRFDDVKEEAAANPQYKWKYT